MTIKSPILYRECIICKALFPYKESVKVRQSYSKDLNCVIAHINQKYCSRKCFMYYHNKTDNPSKKEIARKKISVFAKNRGTKHLQTKEAREKQKKTISGVGHWNWQGGKSKPQCIDCSKKINRLRKRCKKCNGIYIRGDKSPGWRGGIYPLHKKIRNRREVLNWKKAVLQRDNYTCVWCGVRKENDKSVILNVDHIKPFSLYPDLRDDINNGRTLCVHCHRKRHKIDGNYR